MGLKRYPETSYHSNLTFRGPCIVIYSYNKSQRDALFLRFILIKNSVCFGQLYCPSSGVSTLYTAIGIFHASYVDCLLAVYTVLRLLMMDNRSVRNV